MSCACVRFGDGPCAAGSMMGHAQRVEAVWLIGEHVLRQTRPGQHAGVSHVPAHVRSARGSK